MLRCCLRHCDRSSIGEVTWPYRTLEDIDSVPLGLLWSLWKVCLGWFSCWTMSPAIKPHSRQGFILKTAYETLSTCSLVYFAHISTSLRQPCSPKASVIHSQSWPPWRYAGPLGQFSLFQYKTTPIWPHPININLISPSHPPPVLQSPVLVPQINLAVVVTFWGQNTDAFGLQGCLKEVDMCAK